MVITVQGEFHLPEQRKLEQYFFSRSTVDRFLRAFEWSRDPVCLTTPTLGDGFYRHGRHVTVLDIDERFDYLPGYQHWDILDPEPLSEPVEFLVVDPPFFQIDLKELRNAIDLLSEGCDRLVLVIGYLRREERNFLRIFADYGMRPTRFPLEYQTTRPNKWKNCALYSNWDFPGIKCR